MVSDDLFPEEPQHTAKRSNCTTQSFKVWYDPIQRAKALKLAEKKTDEDNTTTKKDKQSWLALQCLLYDFNFTPWY